MEKVTSFIIKRRRYRVKLVYADNYIYFHFGYSPDVIAEVKESMQGAHYCGYDKPPRKIWRIDQCPRNEFRIAFLQGQNPYAPYDVTPENWVSDLPLYEHQKEMAAHWYNHRFAIFACEMGTGKTLAAIDVCNRLIKEQNIKLPSLAVWYIGPGTGIRAVQREFIKWNVDWQPRYFTYNAIVKEMKQWHPSKRTPNILIVDESSYIKTPTAQRTQAIAHLAVAIRTEYPKTGYIVEMSGTPAPKAPIDWWAQCEVACPGFLREANIHKMKNRMAIVEERESMSGGVYPHLVAWKDSSSICAKCGRLKEDVAHKQMVRNRVTSDMEMNSNYHDFQPSINEVEKLYQRMKGLVIVKFKKECLDLPDKQYQTIRVMPTPDTIRAAKLIKSTATRAVTALTRLRELSDGFQYSDVVVGLKTCTVCGGAKVIEHPVYKENVEHQGNDILSKDDFVMEKITCPDCGGKGEVNQYARSTVASDCPKDEALRDLLKDQFEQYGRAVLWAGFTGTIEKLITSCVKLGWEVLRYDKQVKAYGEGTVDDYLDAMDLSHPRYKELLLKHPKLIVIGHPKAGGMALTLTASPGCIYYSNDYSAQARSQSEDRVHRTGMDDNRACVIYDLVHLETDVLVIDNLKKKRDLQAITLGQIKECKDGTDR